jgi:hypothetical protein
MTLYRKGRRLLDQGTELLHTLPSCSKQPHRLDYRTQLSIRIMSVLAHLGEVLADLTLRVFDNPTAKCDKLQAGSQVHLCENQPAGAIAAIGI